MSAWVTSSARRPFWSGGWPARPSVRLVATAAVLAVLLVGAGVTAAYANLRSERERITREALLHTHAAGASTEEFVLSQIRLMQALASTPALRSANPDTITTVLAGLPVLDATLNAVAWIDTAGDVRARTPPQTAERVNVADREHVQAVLATARPYVSSALIPRNPTVAGPSVVIAVPVFDDQGRINGLLGNTITLDALAGVLAPFADATSALVVVDRSGRVLVNNQTGERNQDVSGALLLQDARRAPSGVRAGARNVLGSSDRLVAWQAAPSAQWLVFLDRPTDAAFGPARRTFLAVLAGLLAVALAAVAVAVLVGRRLDRHDAERSRAAAALRSSRDQLDVVLQSVNAAITARDMDGRYLFANASAMQLLAVRSPEEISELPTTAFPAGLELFEVDGTPVPPEHSPFARARRGEQVPDRLLRWRVGPRGRDRWIRTRSTPIRDAQGRPVLVVSVTTDVTDEQRQEAAQQALAGAGVALAGDLDVVARLTALAGGLVPDVADYCAVHLQEPDGPVRRVAAAHRDPDRESRLLRLYPAMLPGGGKGPVTRALETGKGVLAGQSEALSGPEASADPAFRTYLDELAPESVIAAPLVARGRTLGVLTLVMTGSGRQFSTADVPLAEELGRRAGMAVDNARLYEDARSAEEQARRYAERVAVLADASQAFAEAGLEGPAVAESIARTVAGATGDGCILRLIGGDGALGPAAVAHPTPDAAAALRAALAAAGEEPMARRPGDAVRAGRTLRLPADDAPLAAGIHPAFHGYVERFGVSGVLVAPLRVRGRVTGTLTMAREGDRPPYTDVDAQFVQELADRAAVAIENAVLHEAERRARERAEAVALRITQLQSVTAGLSEALTAGDVAAVTLSEGLEMLGAAAGAVFLLSPDGATLEALQFQGYQAAVTDTWQRFAVMSGSPPAEAVREGRACWLGDITARSDGVPMMMEAAQSGAFSAHASIPLRVEGRCVGVLALSFREPRDFASDDEEAGAALARQCAQALERARLYEAEHLARAEAEAANRAKDDFLSTLSHELRTPLTSMLGWARLLRSRRLDAAATDEGLATIERASRTQARLIEELLDVSRIVSGKLALDLHPLDLAPVVRAAVDAIRPAADLKGISLTIALEPNAGAVHGDAERLQQVFGNLLGNAIKFTPPGGRIAVRLRREGTMARISVEDTGAGFGSDFAPHLFERFRQADASSTREHGGLGLGLAIVKSLVELHGGSVQAVSGGLGQGATFTLALPLRSPGPGAVAPPNSTDDVSGQQAAQPLAGLRVLWVEDDAGIRGVVTAMLEGAGAAVESCAGGDQALAAAARFLPDVLISDIAMPRMDGYELLRQLRRSDPRYATLPALALTAHAGAADRIRALELGFDRYLAKPVEPAALVAAVTAMAGRTLTA